MNRMMVIGIQKLLTCSTWAVSICMLLFRTSYREYISLQITETFCRNGKFKINCHHVYCQFDKLEIIVLSTVFLRNHRLLKVVLEEPCNQRRRNWNVNENTTEHAAMQKRHSKENRDWASAQCKIERGMLHVQQKTERPGCSSWEICRRATEMPEQREARLQWMSSRQQERLATEMPEQREARLQRMSSRQQERLAAETSTRCSLGSVHAVLMLNGEALLSLLFCYLVPL